MTTLREVAQQALEACEQRLPLKGQAAIIDELNNLRAALAQQAEPLNLRDPAVQKRLATQWGYVPAAQAEPVEPVATLTAQRDALLEALKLARSIIGHPDDAHSQMIDAAIKAVEEGK